MKNKNGETWCQSHLADQQLHRLLEKVDADLAEEAGQEGCLYCHGKLHRADFDRKPRSRPQLNIAALKIYSRPGMSAVGANFS